MSIKFLRKRFDDCRCYKPHPQGFSGIGIHALSSNRAMTIEEIMQANKIYSQQYKETNPPTWGELIRDIGLFVCFNMVDVIEE